MWHRYRWRRKNEKNEVESRCTHVSGSYYLMILGTGELGSDAHGTLHSEWMLTVSVPEPCVKTRARHRPEPKLLSRFEVVEPG